MPSACYKKISLLLVMKKGISRLFAGECFLQNASFLCIPWKYSCYGKTWWFSILLIIPFYVYEMAKSASALCCFFVVFKLFLHYCMQSHGVGGGTAGEGSSCLSSSSDVLKSGKRAWDQQGLAPADTHRGSTSSSMSWCLLLAAWITTRYLKTLKI